jgi:two-component system C4-dicarboxylate transport response regulator DctD
LVDVGRAAELPAATGPSAAPGAEERLRILLVDEDAPAAASRISEAPISEALAAAGFSVDVVSDGWEALASFARHPYDLVISGIAIAGLGGIELTRRLRQSAPGVPIVLTSGHANHGSVLEDLPHSHIAYLQKPFSGALLVAIVRSLLPPPEEA